MVAHLSSKYKTLPPVLPKEKIIRTNKENEKEENHQMTPHCLSCKNRV
jgi:hypothetical protein